MAMLYDKGLFEYEDKICKIWPKFGKHGKDDIKICDVLRHESGLAHFSKSIPTIKDAWPENIKLNKIGTPVKIDLEKSRIPSKRLFRHSTLMPKSSEKLEMKIFPIGK